MKKEILIGVLVSILATFCGLFLFVEYMSELDFVDSLKKIHETKALSKIIVLAAIPNLFVFFVFLKKQQEYRARGVIMGTIFIAFITFVLKFI